MIIESYPIKKTKRPNGSEKKRLDLPDPRVGEREITLYIKSGKWRYVVCASNEEARDFQWFAIDRLKPILNIERREWNRERLARYESLLGSLVKSDALNCDEISAEQTGPGVYALYHEVAP